MYPIRFFFLPPFSSFLSHHGGEPAKAPYVSLSSLRPLYSVAARLLAQLMPHSLWKSERERERDGEVKVDAAFYYYCCLLLRVIRSGRSRFATRTMYRIWQTSYVIYLGDSPHREPFFFLCDKRLPLDMALEHYTKTIEKKLRLRSYNITYAVFFFFVFIKRMRLVMWSPLKHWRDGAPTHAKEYKS